MKKILLLGSLWGLVACSSSPTPQKLVKSLQTVQSWTATAQMVAESWLKGTLPNAYAEQTLEKSQAEITKETKELTDASLQQHSQRILQTLYQLTVAVKHHQKAMIAAQVERLSTQRQQLAADLKAQEKQL